MKKKLSEESKPKTKKVQFNLHAPEAERVFLAGDFNHWDVHGLPMKRDNKGTWEVSFVLPPEGVNTVSGLMQSGMMTHAQERVENPFGSQDCVRMMS